MRRVWQPGDVAMWSVDDCADEIVFRYVDYKNDNEHAWATVDSGDGYPREGELRPLVVIDPEDESGDNDISRLCALIGKHHGSHGAVDLGLDWCSLQAALREFADPKPPTCRSSVEFRYGDGPFNTSTCTLDADHDGMHSAGPFMWGGAA